MTRANGLTVKRPYEEAWDDVTSDFGSGASPMSLAAGGLSTAQTSAVPTPVYTPTEQQQSLEFTSTVNHDYTNVAAGQSNKVTLKRVRVKAPQPEQVGDLRQEHERRRDMFV